MIDSGHSSLQAEKNFPVDKKFSRTILYKRNDAGWSSPVARKAHNLEAVGSNPAPAT